MYKVYLDGEMIYSPGSEDLVLIDPTLELELNAPGEFTFTMLQNHPYYDLPRKMLSRVDVYRNDELLFRGRIIDESIDFYKDKTLTCEGELAFLNDSIQRPAEYHDMTVRGYLQTLIEYHNEQVEEDKQFTVGTVTVTDSNDSLFRYTNNNSTMEEIKEDLIDDLGGYLRVRNQNGVRYLDYLDIVDYGITNDNAIRFGTNLLDFTQDMDVTDIATVIIPLGERLEESPIEALDMRLTIESVNDGKDWLQSDEAVETYGRITKVVTWDDVTLPENLLSKGQRYLSDTQWDAVELTATAIDMNLIDAEMDAFHLGDQLRVTSSPHGLDRYFPLSKMTLPLDAPESNEYTLGLVTTPSLMGQLTATQADIQSQLGSVSARVSDLTGTVDEKASEVLQEAKDNATQLITSATAEMQAYSDALNEATSKYAEALAEGNAELAEQYYKEMQEYAEKLVSSATASGHVVIEAPYNEILIMDTEDKTTAQRVWRWNLNGLGYSKTGYNGEYGLAMTMDGAIVADYITTGILRGANKNNYWDMDSGELVASQGKIGGWVLSGGKLYNDLDNYSKTAAMQAPSDSITWVFAAGGSSHSSYADCPFRVDKNGNLYADSGTFKGDITGGTIKIGSYLQVTNAGQTYINNPYFVYGIDLYPGLYFGSSMTSLKYYLAMYSIGTSSLYVGSDFSTVRVPKLDATGNIYSYGNISCLGTKSRVVQTENYGDVLLYSYETASPAFGDFGSGVVGNDGETTIFLEPELCETIDMMEEYQVMVTQTSKKDIKYVDKQKGYFTVYGEEGATFDWEIMAHQKDYPLTRFEDAKLDEREPDVDFHVIQDDYRETMDTLECLQEMENQYERQVDLL